MVEGQVWGPGRKFIESVRIWRKGRETEKEQKCTILHKLENPQSRNYFNIPLPPSIPKVCSKC